MRRSCTRQVPCFTRQRRTRNLPLSSKSYSRRLSSTRRSRMCGEAMVSNQCATFRHTVMNEAIGEILFLPRRTYMVKRLIILALFGAAAVIAPVVKAQKGSAENQRAKGVPEQYAGNWVCQTFMPGYNILLPNADMSHHVETAT